MAKLQWKYPSLLNALKYLLTVALSKKIKKRWPQQRFLARFQVENSFHGLNSFSPSAEPSEQPGKLIIDGINK